MSVSNTNLDERVVVDSTDTQGMRVAWGGVWTGYLVAIGAALLLGVLGLAIGVSAADVGPGEDLNAKGLGLGAVIWSGLTLLVSLFIGGLVATRTGMVHDRATGVIEGVLIWVLSILTMIYMAASGISTVGSGVLGALGGATRGAAAAVQNIDVSQLASGDVSQITARLKDPKTAQLVSRATGTPQDETRARLGEIANRVDAAKDDPAKAAEEARKGLQDFASKAGARAQQAAADAKPYATATIWTTLIALALALIASILGAMSGRRQVVHRLAGVMTSVRSSR
jgi:hypothetical protein